MERNAHPNAVVADDVGRVFLDDIVFPATREESVRLYVRVETGEGEGRTEIAARDLVILDNASRIDPDDVELSTVEASKWGTAAVLVLDASRSMRGQPFDNAKRAALGYLDQMGDLDQVAVIAFDDDVHEVADFGTPREDIRARITALGAARKTLSKRVWDAAREGLATIERSRDALPRRVYMIVFSDGRDSGSEASPSSLLAQALGGANLGRTPVFSVGYMEFGSAGLSGLDEISAGTGAKLYELHSPHDLETFFDDVSTRMNQSYVATYPAAHDGARHTIEVRVANASDSRPADFPRARNLAPVAAVALLLLAAAYFVSGRLRRGKPEGELVVVSGANDETSFTLDRVRVRIGAHDSNDVVLNFPSVSRFHAEIVFVRRGPRLVNRHSRNGTFVNDQRVYTRGSIRAGDRIRLGEVELFYRV